MKLSAPIHDDTSNALVSWIRALENYADAEGQYYGLEHESDAVEKAKQRFIDAVAIEVMWEAQK